MTELPLFFFCCCCFFYYWKPFSDVDLDIFSWMTLSDLHLMLHILHSLSVYGWLPIRSCVQTYSHKHLAEFCRSWDSLQEIDSSWTLFFQGDAATIWGRYTPSFVRCLCECSYALTHRIWVSWREDRLWNKWLLSHKGRLTLMSLSSQLAWSMSSS